MCSEGLDSALWIVRLIAGVFTILAGFCTSGALLGAAYSSHYGGSAWSGVASLGVSLVAGALTYALAKLTLYCHRQL